MSTTTIGRARLRTREEPGAARRRCAFALSGLDLAPAGLPPSAILIVRRVVAPLPLSPAPRPASARVEAALRSELDQSLAAAARPRAGRVDGASEAVLFADAAELLACLALDAARGVYPHAWYWRDALRALGLPGRAADHAPHAVWAAAPRAVPAAIETADAWGALDEVAAALRPDGAALVSAALERIWSVPDAAVRAAFMERASGAKLERGAGPTGAQPSAAVSDSLGGDSARSTPADDTTPAPLARCLVVAFAVAHARGRVPDTDGWRALVSLAIDRVDPAPADARVTASDSLGPARAEPTWTHDARPRPAPAIRPPAVGVAPESAESTPSQAAGRTTPGTEESSPTRAGRPTSPEARAQPPVQSPSAEPRDDQADPWRKTRLGGAFYLFNVEGPPECDGDASPGPAAWVELLARALFTADDDADDALWPLLAELDGREAHEQLSNAERTSSITAARDRLFDLARALGFHGLEPLAELLRVPARCVLTRTHFDVVFPLESISLPLRRLGLDRDPGWSSALQRVLAFHFR